MTLKTLEKLDTTKTDKSLPFDPQHNIQTQRLKARYPMLKIR